jgi:diguanylate cyclase (GGDEF)-like protein
MAADSKTDADGYAPAAGRFLEGIASGACIWDADLRLVAWNDAYRDILDVPERLLKPGARLGEILDNTQPLFDDRRTGADLEVAVRQRLSGGGGFELDRVHANGHVVSVTYHPLAGGAWLALYCDVTEQRRDIRQLRDAAAALSQQNARLDAALDSMPYGFSIWDDEYRLVLSNRRYAEIYGMPADRIRIGMTLFEICELTVAAGNHPGVTPSDLYRTYCDRLRKCDAPGVTDRYDKLIKGRTIRTSYARSPGLGWVITHEDISEDIARMKALHEREAELARQKLRLEAAVNNMAQGLCMFDAERRLVISNQQYARLYRLPPELLEPGTPLRALLEHRVEHGVFPAGQRDTYVEERLNIADAGKEDSHVVEFEDGRILRVSHHPMPDGGWVATQDDITEDVRHVRAIEDREAALAVQNMRFEAAVNNMSQGLCMFDADRRLVICNDNYASIYGLPADLVRPGTPLQKILDYRVDHGIYPPEGKDAYVRRRIELVENARDDVDTVELRDGRVISIIHHPLPDGGWVATHQDITEQRRTEARIRHLARHDSLTDLPNRLMFREIMDGAEQRIGRGEVLAVLAIDLDHFKSVNDTLGHSIGDTLLTAAASRLNASCREGDVIARLGGDEFAILTAPLLAAEDAAALADRVVKRIAEPFDVAGHAIVVGASVGIAVAPGDGADAETLLKNADLALYRAKNNGRGAYHFFEKGMDAALQERRELELGLRQALARSEFRLVFQPLFNLSQGRICGLEALLRWYSPDRGVVEPGEFIPVAEETGLIVQIGEWVLREACRAAVGWPADIRVAVNLSAMQFRNRGLLGQVKAALEESGLPADRLELEVTETLLLSNTEMTLRTLHELHKIGVRISMDDFGTGYSSLSYLRSFPFDKIKIDQSFVQDLSAKEDSRAIVKAVIGLGRSLGMSTTAEGVETEAQLDLVRQQGCTEVQGFLLSPPLPATAVSRLFSETGAMAEWTRTLTERR